MRAYLLPLFFVLTAFRLPGQPPTQTLRGRVIDAVSLQPLADVSVALPNADPVRGAATDTLGRWRIDNLPVGRYQLRCTRVGYQPFLLPDVLLQAGKEEVITVALQPAATVLTEVTVASGAAAAPAPVSARVITVEETRRLPATFYDPARLAALYPGVVAANDQGNALVVRGNSPNGVLWRLEEVDIVNPNHLSNTGTFSDRPTFSGGGVNILSGQLLDRSYFLTGAFPAGYGNALGGVFDMRLRRGNNERHEFTAQAGLLGIDLAAEGPLHKGGGSFLVNYRYSTLGLLSALGVQLGDEDISFQDLAFHLALPAGRAGTFTLFGMGGKSRNDFEAPRDTAAWALEKDRFDIRFASRMGALGATHHVGLGRRASLQTSVALSGQENQRTGDRLTGSLRPERLEADQSVRTLAAGVTRLRYHPTERLELNAGLRVNREGYQAQATDRATAAASRPVTDGRAGWWLWQPYASGQLRWGQLTAHLGLHLTHLGLTGAWRPEPRASLVWAPAPAHRFTLAYGRHSQTQLPGVYFSLVPSDGGVVAPNRRLQLTRANHTVVGYQGALGDRLRLTVESYYQRLFDVPVGVGAGNPFSVLNLLEGYVDQPLVNAGQGRNVGLDVALERLVTETGFYYVASASLYQATYRQPGGDWQPGRYDGNYAVNLTAGKEWPWRRRGKERTFGANVRLVGVGGFRAQPIDEGASRAAGYTVYQAGAGFSQKLPDYYKADLRLTLRRQRARYTRTLSLDVQNVTNRRNLAFYYYDAQAGKRLPRYQLGIIPVVSYRVDF